MLADMVVVSYLQRRFVERGVHNFFDHGHFAEVDKPFQIASFLEGRQG